MCLSFNILTDFLPSAGSGLVGQQAILETVFRDTSWQRRLRDISRPHVGYGDVFHPRAQARERRPNGTTAFS